VGLDAALAWSDAVALGSEHVDPTHGPDPALSERVVNLYRGAFLEGVSQFDSPEYESWMTLERSSWEQRYLTALAHLVNYDTERGEIEAAIDLAHRYLEVDELAENMHRRLIELHAYSGDRNGAVRQYERCAEILERELGVEPLPETQAAYRAALEGVLTQVAAPPAEPAWAAVPVLNVPLVGRAGLLSELESTFARVRAGAGTMVLLSGEPGIGKTRLMAEFAQRLEGRAHLLRGAGHPDSQLTPYQPLVDALRPALVANPTWLEKAGCCFDEISMLMPELRGHPGSRAPRETPRSPAGIRQRTGLFEALARLVLGMASGARPLVLLLDDLHWADSTTIDWLGFLARRLGGERLLVVGSYNTEDPKQVSVLHHALAQARVDSEYALPRLAPQEIHQILRDLREVLPPDRELADLLCQATGGNPLYLVETLHALSEATCDVDDLDGMVGFCVPDAVREAVEGRLSRLSPVARQVLEAGAVLGPSFTLEQAQRISGRSEMETMDGLDELVARQLLHEGSTRHRFRHEVIRAAVYRSLGASRRRLLHRRSAEALEQLSTHDLPALTRHFENGGEPARAALYSLEAARAAKAVFGHEEALRGLDRALKLLDQHAATAGGAEPTDASLRLRIEVLYERGWVYRLLGQMDAYTDDLEEEARLAETLGEPGALAHLRFRQAYAHRWFCRYGQAGAVAEEGLALSREAGAPSIEARCLREIGVAARETGDYDAAQEALEAALTIASGLHDPVLELHIMGNLSTLYLRQGEFERSLAMARAGLVRCVESGLDLERRIPLGDIGAASLAIGDLEQAQEALEESLEISRRISDRTQETFGLYHLGWLSMHRRCPEAAVDAFQSGIAIAEEIGSCAEPSALHSGLAEANRLAGRPLEARRHAQRALELARSSERTGDQYLASQILESLKPN
jgi:tetratricopeptide (TPR) repeat protein